MMENSIVFTDIGQKWVEFYFALRYDSKIRYSLSEKTFIHEIIFKIKKTGILNNCKQFDNSLLKL